MRVRNLNVGVESISRWQIGDDVHLPDQQGLRPAFLPRYRPLDEILQRPSLDERLPWLLQPEFIDPDLLEPATLADTRHDVCMMFAAQAHREKGDRRRTLEDAASYLNDEISLDDEVRQSLAMLLRG